MKSLWHYIKAAFNFRPAGMFVAPNWVGVAICGLLGIAINPGILVLGVGVELLYLYSLAGNERFQNLIDGLATERAQDDSELRLAQLLAKLPATSSARFTTLQERCRSVLDFYEQSLTVDPAIVSGHEQTLNEMVWIFLQLLNAQRAIGMLMDESRLSPKFKSALAVEISQLEARLKDQNLAPELRRSLESQREIAAQRVSNLAEVEKKRDYIEAELSRIEQQVELMREQAVVSKDSQAIASRIDVVSSTLGETSQWLREYQSLLGGESRALDANAPQVLVRRSTATERMQQP
jgi:hypothetical protein